MSIIQNLNQIRARHVLGFANQHKRYDPDSHAYVTTIEGENGGEVVKKIPPVVMNYGLLSALAYSMETKVDSKTGRQKHHPWRIVFDGVADHLSSRDVAIIPSEKNTAELLLDFLAEENTSSAKLRDATDEAMLWLEFARRLV